MYPAVAPDLSTSPPFYGIKNEGVQHLPYIEFEPPDSNLFEYTRGPLLRLARVADDDYFLASTLSLAVDFLTGGSLPATTYTEMY